MSLAKPTLYELLGELSETVAADWIDLGINLGFKDGQLRAIQKNQLNDVHDCLRAMLAKWQEVYPDEGWDDIISALRKMKRNDIANEIARKYGVGNSSQSRPEPRQHDESTIASTSSHRGIVNTSTVQSLSAVEAFTQLQSDMVLALRDVAFDLANQCEVNGLIAQSICRQVMESHTSSQHDRVTTFMMAVTDKVKWCKSDREARKLITDFSNIVRNADPALKDVADEIGQMSTYSELKAASPRISEQIRGSFQTIALKAQASHLITDAQQVKATNPHARYNEDTVSILLNNVKAAIEVDDRNMDKFIGVLRKIGPPIDLFVDKLNSLMSHGYVASGKHQVTLSNNNSSSGSRTQEITTKDTGTPGGSPPVDPTLPVVSQQVNPSHTPPEKLGAEMI